MNRDEFNAAKQSGELVTDAELQTAETTIIEDDQYEEDVEESEEVEQDELEKEQEEAEIELTPKEKTAFDKRLERDTKKIEEKLRKEIEEQTEQKYSKHKEAVDSMGGDPEKLIKAANDAKLVREANQIAENNGWDEDQTQWYINDQKKNARLQELEVKVQISDLKDKPEYAGIALMQQSIIKKINDSNGALDVEQAYWALGGSKRLEQIKLEQQQREIAERNKPKRTVQNDAPTNNTGEKPLSAATLSEARRMGIDETEARRLQNKPVTQTLEEYRAQKAKAK